MTGENNATGGFSAQERAAMKQRAAELQAEAKRPSSAQKAAAEEAELLATMERMPDGDRELTPRVHTSPVALRARQVESSMVV